MNGRVSGAAGFRQCPICAGIVSDRYRAIVRHLAGHKPGQVLAWVRGRR